MEFCCTRRIILATYWRFPSSMLLHISAETLCDHGSDKLPLSPLCQLLDHTTFSIVATFALSGVSGGDISLQYKSDILRTELPSTRTSQTRLHRIYLPSNRVNVSKLGRSLPQFLHLHRHLMTGCSQIRRRIREANSPFARQDALLEIVSNGFRGTCR